MMDCGYPEIEAIYNDKYRDKLRVNFSNIRSLMAELVDAFIGQGQEIEDAKVSAIAFVLSKMFKRMRVEDWR